MSAPPGTRIRMSNDVQPDLISNLPSNVIDNIMDRLPLHDAARMSILSRKWRCIWRSIPNLNFDAQFFHEFLAFRLFRCYELTRIVSDVLLFHDGPIPKFSLYIPEMVIYPHFLNDFFNRLRGTALKFSEIPDISSIVVFLSKHGVREIIIQNHGKSRLRLPSELFSCQNLEILKLRNFELLLPPSFKSFRNLYRLELEHVTVKDYSKFLSFISCCPVLENLILRRFKTHSVVVSGPKLKFLEVDGTFTLVCLKGCQNLESVIIRLDEMVLYKQCTELRDLVKFLSGCCKLQELNLRGYFFELLVGACLWEMSPRIFSHLRKLQLSMIPLNSVLHTSCAIRLINSCPKLEELTVSFQLTNQPVGLDLVDPCFMLQKVRTVHVLFATALDMELRFIELILSRAPVLEKFFVQPNVSVRVNPNLQQKLMNTLMQSPRASTKAQVFLT